MGWRVIDITEDGRYIHADRQFLVVSEKGAELGRIPLPDVHSVLVHAGYATYSHDLLVKLSQYNIPLVVCNAVHHPVSVLWPLEGHHRQAARMRKQAGLALPVQKRLWRDMVKTKIREQAATLAGHDPVTAQALKSLLKQVKTGDSSNVEARAARLYWPKLLGPDFSRDRQAGGLNAHLNYGYTLLRSAMARAVSAGGLNPALGVGHVNQRNAFALVDDLMEPFRPLVDRLVFRHRRDWQHDLSPQAKAALVALLRADIQTPDGETDLVRVMTLVVSGLIAVIEGTQPKLYFPHHISVVREPLLPLDQTGAP